jgi:histidyl-tRNA synthetase
VVRGLDYYTGAVFEAELTFESRDETGQLVRFGSVGGGGRYDDLVARFRGEAVPATGFSMGVSRLYAALKHLGRAVNRGSLAPVVVLVMDRERAMHYQHLTSLLRAAGIRAERLGPSQSPALWRRTTTAVADLAVMTHRPVALLIDVMHPATAEDLAA